MASYNIEWKSSAARELRSLPKDVIAEIVERVTNLGKDPFPPGVKKLAGAEHTYRISLQFIPRHLYRSKRQWRCRDSQSGSSPKCL